MLFIWLTEFNLSLKVRVRLPCLATQVIYATLGSYRPSHGKVPEADQIHLRPREVIANDLHIHLDHPRSTRFQAYIQE